MEMEDFEVQDIWLLQIAVEEQTEEVGGRRHDACTKVFEFLHTQQQSVFQGAWTGYSP